jgi:hypothetical protein
MSLNDVQHDRERVVRIYLFVPPLVVETFDLMSISIPFSFLFTFKKKEKKNEAGGWAV